jgi:hypothetical protein
MSERYFVLTKWEWDYDQEPDTIEIIYVTQDYENAKKVKEKLRELCDEHRRIKGVIYEVHLYDIEKKEMEKYVNDLLSGKINTVGFRSNLLEE